MRDGAPARQELGGAAIGARAAGAVRPRSRGLRVAGVLLAVATLGALAHVWVRMTRIQAGYDLGRARQANQELLEQQRRLQIEIGMLKDPDRVVSFARDQLGMAPATPAAIRVLAAPAAKGPVTKPPGEAVPAKATSTTLAGVAPSAGAKEP